MRFASINDWLSAEERSSSFVSDTVYSLVTSIFYQRQRTDWENANLFVGDFEGLNSFTIDNTGTVTKRTYDSEGQCTQIIRYAKPLDVSALPAVTFLEIEGAVDSRDPANQVANNPVENIPQTSARIPKKRDELDTSPLSDSILKTINEFYLATQQRIANKKARLLPLQQQAKTLKTLINICQERERNPFFNLTKLKQSKPFISFISAAYLNAPRRLKKLIDSFSLALNLSYPEVKLKALQDAFQAEYNRVLEEISKIEKQNPSNHFSNLGLINALFTHLNKSQNNDLLIDIDIIESMLNIIEELTRKAKDFRARENREALEQYMTAIETNIKYTTKSFLDLLEKAESEYHNNKDFFDLIKNLLTELNNNEETFSHRSVSILILRQDILNIACDVYRGKIEQSQATEALFICVESERALAQADSRRKHSRYANTLTTTTSQSNLFKTHQKKPADFSILADLLIKAINNYQQIQHKRSQLFRNRLFSQQRRVRYNSVLYLIAIGRDNATILGDSGAPAGIDPKIDADETKQIDFSFIKGEGDIASSLSSEKVRTHMRQYTKEAIEKIREEHRRSLCGRLGLTESVLARKLEAALDAFPPPPDTSFATVA